MTQKDQTRGLLAPLLTTGKSNIPSYDIESSDNSDDSSDNSNDITIILESDDENSQGMSSSQLETPNVPKSNEGYTVWTMERSPEPDSSKCHQAVQTDTERPQDCDEYYFMGLASVFKKLSPQKKAEVRMKMERLLFEAEFV